MDEREAAKWVHKLVVKTAEMVIDTVPRDVMKTGMGSMIMYNFATNYLYKVAEALDFDREKVLADINTVFDGMKKQEKPQLFN